MGPATAEARRAPGGLTTPWCGQVHDRRGEARGIVTGVSLGEPESQRPPPPPPACADERGPADPRPAPVAPSQAGILTDQATGYICSRPKNALATRSACTLAAAARGPSKSSSTV